MPVRFDFEQSNEYIITHSGLAAVGLLLSRTQLAARLDHIELKEVPQPDISNGDVMKSYIGLLCQGKNDFDAIEPFRKDEFYPLALDVRDVPSSPTLRQRLDMAGKSGQWIPVLLEESAKLLRTVNAPLSPLAVRLPDGGAIDLLPLDIDVSPFDNSKTKKEGSSRTYKGMDGFAPIFSYLAREGYAIHGEFREGKEHCQKNTAPYIAQSIRYARQVTDAPLLVRLDSGNDSKDNLIVLHAEETKADYIIKRNLRKESVDEWLTLAKEKGIHCQEREGKDVYIGSAHRYIKELGQEVRIVFEVTVRTIDKNGQALLLPQIDVNTYWTSLCCSSWQVIELYHDHGTCEQFHSELKTDLDLERLPSGKFKTNALVLIAGLFAYNLLRIMGQISLQEPDAPLKTKVQRRRIRTVIQNIVYLAARVVRHARRWKLNFGRYCPWFDTARRVYQVLK